MLLLALSAHIGLISGRDGACGVHIGLIGQGWGLWGTSPPRYQSKCSPIVQINNTQKVGTGGGGGGTMYTYIYTQINVYIYIYIERERGFRVWGLGFSFVF